MSKALYLRKVIESANIYNKTFEINENEIYGSSPPSIFIGSYGYPYVYAGPLISKHEECSIFDTPEHWLKENLKQHDIIKFRLSLLRGKKKTRVSENTKFIENLKELALANKEPYTIMEIKNMSSNINFNKEIEEHALYGPSAEINNFYIDNTYWNPKLEKFYYDRDAEASTAVKELYLNGVPFSSITKCFSAGCFGIEKNRKLVPTRWAITAVDSMLGNMLLKNVRQYEIIDEYRIYNYNALFNSYYILLVPSHWIYEWFEAFLHIYGDEELIFNDAEFHKKTGYSSVGGCFYTCRFAVLEALERMKIQAGCFVFREAYKGYVPLGVFNVRECVREAMKKQYLSFNTMNEALSYLKSKLKIPMQRYLKQSVLLNHYISKRQFGLSAYL
ncbi:MAG: hypothetical protein QXI89_00365 [Candidatus Anstonellales archaeon]